jgi:predicted nucleic acid-binding Zn ribbon protein
VPIYSFEVLDEQGEVADVIEVTQGMSEPLPTSDPASGRPLRRVFQAPNVATRYTTSIQKNKMSDKNLDRLGFTKYKKEGGGIYRKTAGEGPAFIDKGAG